MSVGRFIFDFLLRSRRQTVPDKGEENEPHYAENGDEAKQPFSIIKQIAHDVFASALSERSRPQNRQTIASVFISSAQYGHVFVLVDFLFRTATTIATATASVTTNGTSRMSRMRMISLIPKLFTIPSTLLPAYRSDSSSLFQ
jgi:hypothetical protein